MGTRRAALIAVLIVTAVAVPSGAWASWATSSPGTAAAAAGTFTAPTPAFGAITCTGSGNKTASVPVSWPAVAGALSYDVQSDTAPLSTQAPTSVTGLSTTIAVTVPSDPKKKPTLNVRVRPRAGDWLTTYGTTISEGVTCP
jgi:hypothetical protein